MPLSEAQKKASKKYNAANFESITVRARKGTIETIKAAAAATGESVNGFLTRAINEALEELERRDIKF
ncbi:MAG: hypothetical protein LBB67_07860 [Oscillospiraceae bacterium]|jgi:uncharacterized protein (DUF1778 family)|nr:hypothetical protein [Oscillospiraceae bacterium]